MVENQHYEQQEMDPEEEQAYMMQMQMHQQQQQEIYADEYGQEAMMGNQMQQMPYGEVGDATTALTLAKVYGFNKDIDQGVHFLTDDERTEIFYSSAHTGVIYDYVSKKQKLLQGHCNQITSILCSDDKEWVVTADAGDDSMLVVWNSKSATPVRTFLKPHPGGVKTMDLSTENHYIATLGADEHQTCSLWDWTDQEKDGPIVSMRFNYTQTGSAMHWIKFNPNDPHELACNGTTRCLFMKWSEQSETFFYYSPDIGRKELPQKPEEHYTKTIFLPSTEKAVTGTRQGEILVWEVSKIKTGIGQIGEKKLEKVVQLNIDNSAINILLTVDNYLVCGNEDGTIRFYDVYFKAEAWFEDQHLSEVKSISFSRRRPIEAGDENNLLDQDKAETNRFKCSDFLVADSSGMVAELKATMYEAIDANKKRGITIMKGLKSAVSAIAVHPNQALLAVAQDDGWIGIYEYDNDFKLAIYDDITKKDKKQGDKLSEAKIDKKDGEKPPRKRLITCMEFTPDGELLIALARGDIKVMSMIDKVRDDYPADLSVTDKPRTTPDSIKQLVVSADGQYFACSDTNNCVILYKKDHLNGDPEQEVCWQFNGKQMTHTVGISSICFSNSLDENDTLRLFSIGKDRRCFEYDVAGSSMHGGLPIVNMFSLEKESLPTACIWYPSALDSKEGLILTANNEYKMKLWNPTTKSSRRTCLGPTYGGEISKLKLLDEHSRDGKQYLLYSTDKKVIGLIQLPLDGNPHKTMGLIAHPNEVQDICASADGKFVFTCGGSDLAVNMWHVDVSPIEQAIAMGGENIEPFVQLIEGGMEGQTYQDINDFFYYSMIKAKKENTTKTRKLSGSVPVNQLPNLMRAMGYYPTQQEIQNMMNEVRFSTYTDSGEPNLYVDLPTFIKLFVNHRPVYGIGKNNIDEAFSAIIADIDDAVGGESLHREELIRLLSTDGADGEEVQIQELQEILGKLVSEQNIQHALPENISSERFAEDILGFEEVDENEDEEEDGGEGAGANAAGGGASANASKLGVIQEEP